MQDISERKKAEEEVERLSYTDALTGLANRRMMMERLSRSLSTLPPRRQFGALVLANLDHFAEINDSLGHHQGDELLRRAAARLRDQARPRDVVARSGGDEFALIMYDLGDDLIKATDQAADLGDRIRATLSQTYDLKGIGVDATSSLGIVMFHDGQSADELLKQADLALHNAKAAGRNRVAFFDPVLEAEAQARRFLLADLRRAVERHQLRMVYQPVVDVHGRIMGVEGLVRWQHPNRGMVSPPTFIPLAEETNLILPIGLWVLEQACHQLRVWSGHPEQERWTIAVNVSARQFNQADFVEHVATTLEQTGARPERLRLELTESMLQDDLDVTIGKMQRLRDLGVGFSLDDFGTGYSSLSYLKKLPIDVLKIDQSFVRDLNRDPDAAAIARTILSLAETLSLKVVAEGVESAGQFEFLKRNGCTAFQGYLFSRPVPEAELLSYQAPGMV